MNILLGGLVLAVGLACALAPSDVARFEEQLDAIGSTRPPSAVEPADWKVTLTRVAGVGTTLFGVLILFDV